MRLGTFASMNVPVLAAIWLSLVLSVQSSSRAMQPQTRDMPTCLPIAQRTSEAGCWIILDEPVGRLSSGAVFWHLDTFPSRAAAEAAKRPGAAIIEALGKIWLMTIAKADFRAGSGDHVAHIGPLPVSHRSNTPRPTWKQSSRRGWNRRHTRTRGLKRGTRCLARRAWRRPTGAWLAVQEAAGHCSRRTTDALDRHGNSTRRAIVLILHDRSQPATTVTHGWTPKGLCQAR